MKKFYAFLLALLGIFTANAQNQKSCCSAPNTVQFAELANDGNFLNAHQKPVDYKYEGEGEWMSFPTTDGATSKAYFFEAEGSDDYLIVIHEWWGLNDHILEEGAKLYRDLGVNVICLDLYDGKTASTQEEAGQLMQSVVQERAMAIIDGAFNHFPGGDFYSIGWCFGGGWSLQTALLGGDRVEAAVMYYGMPVNDTKVLSDLDAPVLGIFAEKDGWINRDVVGKFEKAMDSADKSLEVHWYDAVHAFANPSNPDYDSKATADAHKKTIAFLQKHLK